MIEFQAYLDILDIKFHQCELESGLHRFFDVICERPVDLDALKSSLTDILTFLTTADGRTDYNCRTVDKFFWYLCYEEMPVRDRDDIPDDFRLVIEDIGMCLHDAVSSPDIAANFESLPEQLLQRTLMLDT